LTINLEVRAVASYRPTPQILIISFICPKTREYRVLKEFSRKTSEKENLSFSSLSGFIYTTLASYKLLSKRVLLVTASLV